MIDPLFKETSALVQQGVDAKPVAQWENRGSNHLAIESYVTEPSTGFFVPPLPMAMIAVHYGRAIDAYPTGQSVSPEASAVPYSVMLHPSGTEVRFRSQDRALWFHLLYTSGDTQHVLKKIIGRHRVPLQINDALLPVLARQIFEIATSPTAPRPVRYVERIIDAITAQLEWLALGNRSGEVIRTSDPAVNETVLYIHARIGEPLTIAQLAQLQRMSASLLRQRFQAVMGMPIHRYIIQHRVKTAHDLIESSNLSLTIISAECGFSSLAHMVSTFKRVLGVTPGSYRTKDLEH
ncbi:MAG: AraC family transcriptional regulator [Porticoccaceae bacterium]|jgi:AraC family transcriptional regulator|nr:AraC family transcriptional regulator [Porticoccaceae bacterium]